MGAVVIAGYSNSGKSTSLRYLDPKVTFIVNVNDKPLGIPGFKKNYIPFKKRVVLDKNGKPMVNEKTGKEIKKWSGNYYQSCSYNDIHAVLDLFEAINDKYHIYSNFVIEDINYLLGQDIMDMATVASRDKYSTFAYNYNKLIRRIISLNVDNVIITSHLMTEELSNGKLFTRMACSSKLMEKASALDGMFNWIFYAEKIIDDVDETVKYVYRTRTNGYDTCRSTSGCFKDKYIKPNIQAVLDRIKAFEEGTEEPEYEEEDDILSKSNKASNEPKSEDDKEKSSKNKPAVLDDDI